MKSILLSITVIISVIFIPVESLAQSNVTNGLVITFDTIPVINANIKAKGSKQEVITDSNGRFEIECESDDVLTVSANGFNSEKVKLDGESGNLKINLKLKSGDKNLKAAIDNGHVSNAESFSAIASKNSSGEDYSQYANIYEILQGKFPGVQIINGEIIIRGMSSMQMEPNTPNSALIVVDGVINNSSILNTLPTSEVESIKIVKDGGSALYGSRGGNGVVVIKMKK